MAMSKWLGAMRPLTPTTRWRSISRVSRRASSTGLSPLRKVLANTPSTSRSSRCSNWFSPIAEAEHTQNPERRRRPSATFGTSTRASGGIGRRAGFRFLCPKGRGGSSPPSPTDSWVAAQARTPCPGLPAGARHGRPAHLAIALAAGLPMAAGCSQISPKNLIRGDSQPLGGPPRISVRGPYRPSDCHVPRDGPVSAVGGSRLATVPRRPPVPFAALLPPRDLPRSPPSAPQPAANESPAQRTSSAPARRSSAVLRACGNGPHRRARRPLAPPTSATTMACRSGRNDERAWPAAGPCSVPITGLIAPLPRRARAMSRHGQGVGTPKDQGDDQQPGSLPVLIPVGAQAPTFEYLVAVAKIDGERRIPLADARTHLGWSGLLVEMTAAPFWLGVRESPATARRGPHQVLLDERGRLDLGRHRATARRASGRPHGRGHQHAAQGGAHRAPERSGAPCPLRRSRHTAAMNDNAATVLQLCHGLHLSALELSRIEDGVRRLRDIAAKSEPGVTVAQHAAEYLRRQTDGTRRTYRAPMLRLVFGAEFVGRRGRRGATTSRKPGVPSTTDRSSRFPRGRSDPGP